MNPQTIEEAREIFSFLKKKIKKDRVKEIIICPPFLHLPLLRAKNLGVIKMGAQNCFWEEKGPFTGEISGLMLKNIGCSYVILGHSERRNWLAETDEMINKKIKSALKIGLKPILCVGEKESERRTGKTFRILKKQIFADLKDLGQKEKEKILLAYEPVWAIGTGNFCPPEIAKKVLLFLKKFFKKTPILYGGSVDSQNSASYIKVGFNGLLIGSASLKKEEFGKILKIV